MNRKAEERYADIIGLPHHVSTRHPQMSMADRAAQFSPFAALTGHDAAIAETARITDERPLLDESTKWAISDLLQQAAATPDIQLPTSSPIPANPAVPMPEPAAPSSGWNPPGVSFT